MTNWEDLLTREQLIETASFRSKKKIQQKFDGSSIENKKSSGWTIVKMYKNGSALMEQPKKIGDAFEDEVWTIFYKMGFKVMNKTNNFKISYSSNNPNLTKQIDVVAIDDEVCLLVECKATESLNNASWKTDLEAIKGNMAGLSSEIKKHYSGRKIKFIFATKNYAIGSQDKDRMKDAKIANFDTDVIRYYSDLVSHLGSAARYQLLGNLFAKQKIGEMEQRVPAIQGKMGGLTYYSFSIEPERLLKIAYVLHRTNANKDAMPTYQRIIKKDRLNSIRKFINEGGYFPNSLIISIDTDGQDLRFERASNNFSDSISKIGILYLPPYYQSAYVIDGQHRLYGYSDSNYSETNSVPVVAFVNLAKNAQVKMFMDINENQKAVSKSLRNTLNIDLLWNSNIYSERRLSLMLYIAQKLGEDSNSPLYGRVITGENTQTDQRCITIEYLKDALNNSCFFNKYKRNNNIDEIGVFEKYGVQSNEKTEKLFYPFIVKCLKVIQEFCSSEWEKGAKGYLTINNFIYALLRVINDIVDIVVKKEHIGAFTDWHPLYSKCENLLFGLADTILKLDTDTITKIKTAKGGAAKKISWHALQVAFHNRYSDFVNGDLLAYIENNCEDHKFEVEEKIESIERKLIELTKEEFSKDPDWLDNYVPESQRKNLISKVAVENHNRKGSGNLEKVDEWYYVNIDVIYDIIAYQNNWSTFYQNIFTKSSSRQTKTEILTNVKTISNYKQKISKNDTITKNQANEIEQIYKVFCEE